jgi:hypothetical protein
MRCQDCGKMVSFDEPQATVEYEDISDDGQVSIEVRLVLPCAECGAELKESSFSFEHQVEHKCDKLSEEEGFEIEVDDPEPSDDYRPKEGKNGKPTPMRYQKHFYIVTVTGKAICNKCGEEITFELSDEVQSSGMDEI